MRIIIGQFDENLASKVFCCVSPQCTLNLAIIVCLCKYQENVLFGIQSVEFCFEQMVWT